MATLIAYQNGNWTGTTTWKTTSTSTGAAQGTTTGSSNTTTSYVGSSSFTTGINQVLEGILLYCKRLNTTGTVSVAFSADGTTATREVVVNASDLPAEQSWVFFKFATTYTTANTNANKILVKGSSANNAVFYTDATANNWARYIRFSTTATIAASDVTYICDELTGAGTKNDVLVTMNSTSSATSYGQCNIGQGGILEYGTSASTNYVLDLSGNMNVWGGGTLNIGTSGTSIPSTSTAVLEFTNASNVDRGLEVKSGGSCSIYGATKAGTKTLLTSDAASGQAVINVASTTGWVANDVLALGSTTRTSSNSEKATVQTVNSGTQATLTANLGSTHHGATPYVGEVVNLTRNVKIHGTSTSLCAYVNCADTSNFTAAYAEFYYLGNSLTTGKRGIEALTTTGTFSMSFCSIYDLNGTNYSALLTNGASGSPVLEDCVGFFPNNGTILSLGPTTGTPSVQRNWMIGKTGTVFISDVGGTIKDNIFVGVSVTFSEAAATLGTVQDNIQHSAATAGYIISSSFIGTFSGLTAWRNGSYGITVNGSGFTVSNSSFYHNATYNLNLGERAENVIFEGCSINGGSGASLSQTSYQIAVGGGQNTWFNNCSVGNTTAAASFMTLPSTPFLGQATFKKCAIGDAIFIGNQSNLLSNSNFESGIKFEMFNNTANSHRTYTAGGYRASEQTTYKTAAPSEAIFAQSLDYPVKSSSKKFPVPSGTSPTLKVYIYVDGVYDGFPPTLVLKANSIAGITSDTVLSTNGIGNFDKWVELTGVIPTVADDCVLEAYVVAQGSIGGVYVDDWSVTV